MELRAGNYKELVVYVDKTDGTPPDLSGYTVQWRLFRPNAQNPFFIKDSGATGDVAVTDTAKGELTVKIKKADTVSLPQGLYYYEVLVIDALGNETTVHSDNLWVYIKKA